MSMAEKQDPSGTEDDYDILMQDGINVPSEEDPIPMPCFTRYGYKFPPLTEIQIPASILKLDQMLTEEKPQAILYQTLDSAKMPKDQFTVFEDGLYFKPYMYQCPNAHSDDFSSFSNTKFETCDGHEVTCDIDSKSTEEISHLGGVLQVNANNRAISKCLQGEDLIFKTFFGQKEDLTTTKPAENHVLQQKHSTAAESNHSAEQNMCDLLNNCDTNDGGSDGTSEFSTEQTIEQPNHSMGPSKIYIKEPMCSDYENQHLPKKGKQKKPTVAKNKAVMKQAPCFFQERAQDPSLPDVGQNRLKFGDFLCQSSNSSFENAENDVESLDLGRSSTSNSLSLSGVEEIELVGEGEDTDGNYEGKDINVVGDTDNDTAQDKGEKENELLCQIPTSIGMRTLVIENIPKNVERHEVDMFVQGYGDICSYDVIDCDNSLTAKIQVDADLEWIVECIEGSFPFGSEYSEPLKCYILPSSDEENTPK